MYQNFSYREIAEISEVKNFATIKKYLDFKPCRDTETQIKKRITFLIDGIKDVEPTRMAVNGRTRIVGFRKIEKVNEQSFLYKNRCEWSNAFGLPAKKRIQGRTSEVLLRWSIQKLQKESLPADALNSELKYLSYISDMSKSRSNISIKQPKINRSLNVFNIDSKLTKEDRERLTIMMSKKEDSILNVNDFIPLDAVNF
jgi:hypothetical protein